MALILSDVKFEVRAYYPLVSCCTSVCCAVTSLWDFSFVNDTVELGYSFAPDKFGFNAVLRCKPTRSPIVGGSRRPRLIGNFLFRGYLPPGGFGPVSRQLAGQGFQGPALSDLGYHGKRRLAARSACTGPASITIRRLR